MTKTDDYYGVAMTERREIFNRIINGMDMVLMNNIPEVDPEVYENWEGKNPIGPECEIIPMADAAEVERDNDFAYYCREHMLATDDEYECDDSSAGNEIYQWFAVSDNDADFLKSHNQYITYSGLLNTYFLAICHFGTGWDYVDSMVDDILGDK